MKPSSPEGNPFAAPAGENDPTVRELRQEADVLQASIDQKQSDLDALNQAIDALKTSLNALLTQQHKRRTADQAISDEEREGAAHLQDEYKKLLDASVELERGIDVLVRRQVELLDRADSLKHLPPSVME